ncbi:blue copper protein 1b-like [Rosa rugosa]|uniref:blue copper protein 1b-like n=1 Tax=Rosa rugosa TaxID=74645 RepID=UPI002B405F48|nr:blue copper protein 1b-like [Rosa rugosa]
MAYFQLFTILAILAIFSPSISAKNYVVGDEQGWTVEIDYEAWAKGKQFYVGDNLIFKYLPGVHNVVEVKEKEFKECAAPSSTKPLTTGGDLIKLATPGKKWFICSVGKHCELGNQKVAVTVLSSPSSSPSSIPSSSSPNVAPSPSTSSLTSPGPDASSQSEPSPSISSPSGPSPSTSSPSTSAATVGKIYGWLVIVSGIVGFHMI